MKQLAGWGSNILGNAPQKGLHVPLRVTLGDVENSFVSDDVGSFLVSTSCYTFTSLPVLCLDQIQIVKYLFRPVEHLKSFLGLRSLSRYRDESFIDESSGYHENCLESQRSIIWLSKVYHLYSI